MKECHTWKDAVARLCSESAAPLKSVEALLAQGELLPVDFPTVTLKSHGVVCYFW